MPGVPGSHRRDEARALGGLRGRRAPDPGRPVPHRSRRAARRSPRAVRGRRRGGPAHASAVRVGRDGGRACAPPVAPRAAPRRLPCVTRSADPLREPRSGRGAHAGRCRGVRAARRRRARRTPPAARRLPPGQHPPPPDHAGHAGAGVRATPPGAESGLGRLTTAEGLPRRGRGDGAVGHAHGVGGCAGGLGAGGRRLPGPGPPDGDGVAHRRVRAGNGGPRAGRRPGPGHQAPRGGRAMRRERLPRQPGRREPRPGGTRSCARRRSRAPA